MGANSGLGKSTADGAESADNGDRFMAQYDALRSLGYLLFKSRNSRGQWYKTAGFGDPALHVQHLPANQARSRVGYGADSEPHVNPCGYGGGSTCLFVAAAVTTRLGDRDGRQSGLSQWEFGGFVPGVPRFHSGDRIQRE
jgi:hypothetical protein